MKYQSGDLLYPVSFPEWNVGGDVHIHSEDIESYAYPPGERRRYTNLGWDKACALGIASITYTAPREDVGQ